MRKKIIYIIGAGRSGTTLLDILLGNHPAIISCGELNRFGKRAGIPPLVEPNTPTYLFWEKIKKISLENGETIDRLKKISSKFEYHKGLLKSWFWGQNVEEEQIYKNFNKKLLDAIFQTSSLNTLIDSSKYPGRAYQLSKYLKADYDICFLYLKRDPVQVIQSLAKKNIEQPAKNWFAANAYYFLVNTLCEITFKLLSKEHKGLTLKYQDLVNQPVAVLEAIETAFDLNFAVVKAKIHQHEPLSTGGLFDGNRIRLVPFIKIRTRPEATTRTLGNILTRLLNYPLYR